MFKKRNRTCFCISHADVWHRRALVDGEGCRVRRLTTDPGSAEVLVNPKQQKK